MRMINVTTTYAPLQTPTRLYYSSVPLLHLLPPQTPTLSHLPLPFQFQTLLVGHDTAGVVEDDGPAWNTSECENSLASSLRCRADLQAIPDCLPRMPYGVIQKWQSFSVSLIRVTIIRLVMLQYPPHQCHLGSLDEVSNRYTLSRRLLPSEVPFDAQVAWLLGAWPAGCAAPATVRDT